MLRTEPDCFLSLIPNLPDDLNRIIFYQLNSPNDIAYLLRDSLKFHHLFKINYTLYASLIDVRLACKSLLSQLPSNVVQKNLYARRDLPEINDKLVSILEHCKLVEPKFDTDEELKWFCSNMRYLRHFHNYLDWTHVLININFQYSYLIEFLQNNLIPPSYPVLHLICEYQSVYDPDDKILNLLGPIKSLPWHLISKRTKFTTEQYLRYKNYIIFEHVFRYHQITKKFADQFRGCVNCPDYYIRRYQRLPSI